MSKNKFKVSDFIPKDFKIISCSDNDSITKAKTLMLLNDFSQLPIIDSNKKILGAISWKSIGRAESLGVNSDLVSDYMEDAVIIKNSADFLLYIKLIAKNEFLLVQNYHKELVGIITTYDMTINFKDFLVPFLKIGIIEDLLRKLIIDNSIETFKNKKPEELVFNEYIKLFKREENWKKLNFNFLDKETFTQKLDEIRVIRNKIAHYKPEGINHQEFITITSFTKIIEKICN